MTKTERVSRIQDDFLLNFTIFNLKFANPHNNFKEKKYTHQKSNINKQTKMLF
jgi:hypothetical protein